MSGRSHDFYFRIMKSTGDLILEFIEECTDVVREMKQQQPERLKRLFFFFLYSYSQNYS